MPAIGIAPDVSTSNEIDEGLEDLTNGGDYADEPTTTETSNYHVSNEEHAGAAITKAETRDPAHDDDEMDEVSAAKKRAFGSITQDLSLPQAELALDSGNLYKKPRFSEDDPPGGGQNAKLDGQKTASVDSASVSAGQRVEDVQPFSAGDAILVQTSSNPGSQSVAAANDSDDDSDIPEIDPELATEDEEEA